jgi:hypothetical protein
MRTRTRAIAVAGAMFLATAALAQEGGVALRLAAPTISISGSGLSTLIRRADVQGALSLGMRQKNAINELFSQQAPGRVMVSVRGDSSSSPESLQRQVDEQLRTQLTNRDDQIKAILTPEQWNRLLELDLQWRGPLAMADSRVAERLQLGSETRAVIAEAAREYAGVKSEVLSSLASKREDVSPDGTRRAIAMRLDTSELDKPFSPARKKLEKAKQAAERKVLDSLTPEELERWKAACGKPFTFRSDIKGFRF